VCVCVRVLAAQTQEQEGESNSQGSQTAETLTGASETNILRRQAWPAKK